MHKLDCTLSLQPIWWNDPPKILLQLDHHCVFEGALEHDRDFGINQYLEPGTHRLTLTLLNKVDTDTLGDKDKAVVVDHISFFGISSPRFVWHGKYQPLYPEPWASQQTAQGVVLAKTLEGNNYIGWNGTWFLEFTCPIFTWIHQIEDLGWIHK